MDWTTVATAAVTGLLGYGGAWLQARTSITQAQEETKRVRLQHREEHLRNRQGTYHEFLKVLRDYDSMMIDFAPRDDDLINAWTERYGYYRAGIELFGTPDVITAAKRISDVLTETSRAFLGQHENAPRHELLSLGYVAKRAKVLAVRDELVATMRKDVAAPYADPLPDGPT